MRGGKGEGRRCRGDEILQGDIQKKKGMVGKKGNDRQ